MVCLAFDDVSFTSGFIMVSPTSKRRRREPTSQQPRLIPLDRLIDKPQLAQHLRMSIRQVNRKILSGELPKPTRLFVGARKKYWVIDELAAALGQRVEDLRKLESGK